MESKTKKGTNTKPKTKKEIEDEHPFITPDECPGAIINWVVKRDENRDKAAVERDKELVRLIGDTIDKLFEKHFRKYVSMIHWNRVYIILMAIILGVGVTSLWAIVLYHIYK